MKKQYNQELSKREKFQVKKTPKKTLLKKKGKLPKDAIEGRVVATIGKFYLIDIEEQNYLLCIVGGVLITPYHKSTLVAIGDNVSVIKEDNFDKETGLRTGQIMEVRKRKTKLSRTNPTNKNMESIISTNIDQVMIINSVFDPDYNRRLIDRYLIAAEIGDVLPIICINKMDLIEDKELIYEDFEIYKEFGAEVIFVSAEKDDNLESLKEILKDKITVFSGPSGVGKSSIVNKLLNKDLQEVQKISLKTNKGKHTTSSSKMFDLPEGGILIDTPGIREFALWEIEKERLSIYYHDFDEYYEECKYQPCSHTHEPNCRVREAYEEGEIDPQRYESYVNLYTTIEK